ncbi:hypothetical protein COV17_02025 [Candidatus Woesearchaeota archaeon CG10_big_fil_rev_8_21_14_0_10_36_11]|nr:MAG: hypothetical protein COV17_02025 [Candidatus Woesearchaeota archaeon CG10_big_fil_rev_8_21_14_0_10_36_11]
MKDENRVEVDAEKRIGDVKKSPYTFVWSNYQTHFTIQMNINGLKNKRDIIWNRINNILVVSKNNTISCYHSNDDLQDDIEKGKNFLNDEFVQDFFNGVDKECTNCWNLFNCIKNTKVEKISDIELFDLLVKGTTNWTDAISYFRATQVNGIHVLMNKIQETFSDEEKSIILVSPELDEANKELVDWQELIKYKFSKENLFRHVEKHPWIVACHFSYEDVIDTLTQKYNNDKMHLKIKDFSHEKENLKKQQKEILTKHPEMSKLVSLMQKLAVARMKVKSCWAGTDFYLISLFNEIAKRTGELVFDIQKYYLIEEIGELLKNGVKLSDEEKTARKKYFVGLWKNGNATYVSGDEAENLAKQELIELYESQEGNEIKGTVANKGKVVGVVRILESNNIEQLREFRRSFQKGDILVTQMTQPNVIDIAEKSGAIVTEEGGMLSHAAIISREFGIPCIVGTEVATKVFKDGDLVEVDANTGIVRKIGKENKKHSETMKLPTEQECLELFNTFRVPLNIREHCLSVRKLAVFLAEKLKENGVSINIELVDRISLLHDLFKVVVIDNLVPTKFYPYEYSEEEIAMWKHLRQEYPNMHESTALYHFLKDKYPELAIASLHSSDFLKENKTVEESVAHYADWRTKDNSVISLQKRMADLQVRYSRDQEYWKKRISIITREEKRLFSHLSFTPDQLKEELHNGTYKN